MVYSPNSLLNSFLPGMGKQFYTKKLINNFLENNNLYNFKLPENTENYNELIKTLYPQKIRNYILILILIACITELIYFYFQLLIKNKNIFYPLLSYLLIKIFLFSYIIFYNNFRIFNIGIIYYNLEKKSYKLINFGLRLFIQFIFHIIIYCFISCSITCLLLSIFSKRKSNPKYFKLFLIIIWFFPLFISIKEFFIFKIELLINYYKYIHSFIFLFQSSLLLFYKYFWIKISKKDFLYLIIGICFSLFGIFSYLFFNEIHLFGKIIYLFFYFSCFFIGLPIWNSFFKNKY